VRILFGWVCILGWLLGMSGPAAAAPDVYLEKVALTSEWVADGDNTTVFNLASRGDWDWILVKLNGKFYSPLAQENYSSAGASLTFPKFSKDFGLNLSQEWNLDYKIISSGWGYHWTPFPGLKTGINYQASSRKAADGEESENRFASDSETISLGYKWDCLNYDLKFSRAAKDYPVDNTYTSLKLQLDQGVVWQVAPETQLKLLYREDTGDYPNYKDLGMNYWKDEWALQGQFGRIERGRWDWEYARLNWVKWMFPYRNDQHLKLRFDSQLTPVSELSIQVILADLNYIYVQDDCEPGDTSDEDQDLKSRVEKKLGLEYIHDFSPFSVEVGYFGGSFDYKAESAADTLKSGFYSVLRFKGKQFEISLKAAPGGDLQRNDGYFQLKVEYQP
jgi:hypothetical protein